MKNRKFSLTLAAASCLLLCGQASAALVQTLPWNNVGDQDKIRLRSAGNTLSGTTGGAFRATRSDGETPIDPTDANLDSATWIETFCVELGETISLGTTYNATVNYAREIIAGPTDGKDPLSNFGAWLYASWVGYDANVYTTRAMLRAAATGGLNAETDLRVATSMQTLIWSQVGYTETLIKSSGGVSDDEWNDSVADLTAWNLLYQADSKWFGETARQEGRWGDVVVLNLTDADNGALKQDQVAIVPGASGFGEIPEPISLAIWSVFGAVCLVGRSVSRRRSRVIA